MSEELKQHILKNGLTLGLVEIALFVLTFMSLIDSIVGKDSSILLLVLVLLAPILFMIIFSIYQTINFRKSNGGYLSFKEAFTSCTGVLMAGGFIVLVFNLMLFSFIYPEFSNVMIDAQIEISITLLEFFNSPVEQIEESVALIEENSNFSPKIFVNSYIKSIILYTVFGLLVAAFTKKDKPKFSEE
jgi:hypothetical protein